MSFTPEGRAKALATKARKKAERLAAVEPAGEIPQTLADLGLGVTEVEFRVDDILTNEEIEAIRAKARAEVEKERKQAHARKFLDAAREEARRNLGMVHVDEEREREMAEEVDVRINLPRLRLANGREAQPDPIILDQRLFVHGRTYRVPRVQAEYIMDLMQRSWMHVAQVDGRSRTYYSEQLGTSLSFNGFAPAFGGAPGTSFDAIHRRPA